MGGFIKLEGIDGESQDKDHKGWIDIEDFNLGVHKPTEYAASGGHGANRGDTVAQPLVISKHVDKSTPKLFEGVANGTRFSKVEVHITATASGGGKVTYLKFELENVYISSNTFGGHVQSEHIPNESIQLHYATVKVTYTEYDEKGKKKGDVAGGWNALEGKPKS